MTKVYGVTATRRLLRTLRATKEVVREHWHKGGLYRIESMGGPIEGACLIGAVRLVTRQNEIEGDGKDIAFSYPTVGKSSRNYSDTLDALDHAVRRRGFVGGTASFNDNELTSLEDVLKLLNRMEKRVKTVLRKEGIEVD